MKRVFIIFLAVAELFWPIHAMPLDNFQAFAPLLVSRKPASQSFDPEGMIACKNSEKYPRLDIKKLFLFEIKSDHRSDFPVRDVKVEYMDGRTETYPNACDLAICDFKGYRIMIFLKRPKRVTFKGQRVIRFPGRVEDDSGWTADDRLSCYAEIIE